MESHLLQMRGLKPLFKGAFERVFNVASFTGTTIYNIFCKKITGLKYFIIRKTKCFDFWERNVLFPKTKRSFFRTPTPPTLPFSA